MRRRRLYWDEWNLLGGILSPPVVEVPGPRVTLLSVNTLGILSVLYGLAQVYTQTFYLTSPDLTSWQVSMTSATGIITVTSGIPNLGVAGWSLRDTDRVVWTLAIDNNGIITVVSQ